MRTFMWLNEQVCACKMATGWNAPQGVENVHTLCAGKPESDDRGNNISVKRLGTSLGRCIERYIKNRIIIIIIIINIKSLHEGLQAFFTLIVKKGRYQNVN